jgi:uncharacterized membrane protein YkvA (DUF1232 family)
MVTAMVISNGSASIVSRLRAWAKRLRLDVLALYLAARDPRVPLTPKLVASAVAAYALSPIDLIPDFIPVLGLLDDLIIVPLGIALAIRLIPSDVMEECRREAATLALRRNYVAAAVIVVLWAAGLLLLATALFHAAF